MNHLALPRFWHLYRRLPLRVQELANKKIQYSRFQTLEEITSGDPGDDREMRSERGDDVE